MANRAERRRQERTALKAVLKAAHGLPVRYEGDTAWFSPAAGLNDREKLEMMATIGRASLERGMPVMFFSEPLTIEEIEACEAVLDGLDDSPDPLIELPEELRRLLGEVTDPPDASVGWPENVAAHDQAAAALLDLFDTDLAGKQWQTAVELDTLTKIGRVMPSHASVAAVLEFTDGHMLGTLLNQGDGLTVVMAYYDANDPKRLNDANDARVMRLDNCDVT